MADKPHFLFQVAPKHSALNVVLFWMFIWFATVIAGGVCGLIIGGILGLVAGPVCAAIAAVPIQFTIAIVAWASWAWRSHILMILMAATAGALTGVSATWISYDTAFFPSFSESIMLAALIGGLFSGAMGGLIRYNQGLSLHRPAIPPTTKLRFSMRDIFLRISILAILLAIWVTALRSANVLQ